MYKIRDYKKIKARNEQIKRIVSIILYIIIIPIIIVNFTLIIKSFIRPNKIPDFLGHKNLIIVSESMEPTIMVGDAIFIKEVPEKEIKINDIISFHDGQSINTHRVIGISEENGVKSYKTKGDNNKNEDKEKVNYNQIEGKYQFKISNFGNFVKIIQSKITLAILILLVIINTYYAHRLKEKKIERKAKRKKYENNIKNKIND